MIKLNPIVDQKELKGFSNLLSSDDPNFEKLLSIVSLISSKDWEFSRPKSEKESYTKEIAKGINKFYSKDNLCTISVVYIVKNEQDTILSSLESIKELADEIIIVDTGSIDATVEVIEALGDKRIKFSTFGWCDDFSKARNYALEQATCDWVLSLDADEKLLDSWKLRQLLTYLQAIDYFEDTVFNLNIVRKNEAYKTGKIIRNLPNFRYKGKVHETYFSTTGDIFYANIDIDVLSQQRTTDTKKRYYNRLLLETIESEPTNSRWCYFYLRDNLNDHSYYELEELSRPYLSNDTHKELSQQNFKKNYYNVKIVLFLMLKCLQEELWDDFLMLRSLQDEDICQHSDYIFLNYAFQLVQFQEHFSCLSKSFLISYSESRDEERIFPQEYLDSLLGTFLFMDGYYEESRQVFNQLFSSNKSE